MHGRTASVEYSAWRGMKQRYFDPKSAGYKNYGGRGISVDPAWLGEGGFERFFVYLGPRPSAKHSLDRIDVNGPYAPGNVRWATSREQSRNKRNSRRITIDGIDGTLSDWADVSGIAFTTIWGRLRRGWSAWDAVTIPLVRGRPRILGRRGVANARCEVCRGVFEYMVDPKKPHRRYCGKKCSMSRTLSMRWERAA